MAIFEFELPDGSRVQVEAPDETVALQFARGLANSNAAPRPEPGPVGRAAGAAKDWLTGANRDEGIPSAMAIGARGLGLDAKQFGRMMGLLNTTVSDDRMQRGLMQIEPGVQFDRDSRGNLVVVWPLPNGTRTRFYANAPGLDTTDVMMGAGAVSTASGIGALGRMIGLGGYTGAAATGAGEAGLIEGVSSKLTDSRFRPGDVVAGAAGGVAGEKAARVISALANAYRARGSAAVMSPDGEFLPHVQLALREAGLEPEQARAELARLVVSDARRAADPQAAGRLAEAQSLPVPVPMTQGQVTGSKGQQLFEDAAFSGAFGSPAESVMRGQRQRAQEALAANLGEIQGGLAPGRAPIARGEGGAEAQAYLAQQRDAERLRANSLFSTARQAEATIDPATATPLAEGVRAVYREGFNPQTAPVMDRLLLQLDEIAASGDVKSMMAWREQVSNLRKGAPTVDAAAAEQVLHRFDAEMKGVVDNQLLLGTPEAVRAWYNAIQNYADFASTWKSQGGILSTLTDRVTRDGDRAALKVAPEAAANAIFTATASGMANKMGLARDLLTLRRQLPDDQWNALRQEAFIRLMDTSRGAVVGGEQTLSGVNFFRAWTSLTDRNAGVVNALFSSEERKLITQFASVAARATSGAVNASNSANMAAGLIQRLIPMVGGTRMAQFMLRMPLMKGLTEAGALARAAGTIRPSLQPRPALPAGVGAGVGGAVGGSDPGAETQEQMLRKLFGFPN